MTFHPIQRLSTIRNADLIYVISGGGVVESGTHEELMESESGHYRQLVEKQEGKDTTANSTARNVSTQPSMESQESSEFLPSLETAAPKRPLNQGPILEFRNVQFSYPSRPNRRVLKDFNLSVMPGETLALVGPR
jgi:ABC-type multidrug transport system fused ATPase/permease subunit